jgi:coenzyme F420-reducing hydrogenase beta subunit
MKADVMGFFYPVVDESKCVDCSLCDKVCAFRPDYTSDGKAAPLSIFGCRHKDAEELSKSQSGAAGWAIINAFLTQTGGIVYGAGYKSTTHVAHKRADDLDSCREFRGSKYVQSDMRGVFPQVLADLTNGSNVLFFGTPCQVAGLKSFIPKRYADNLFTADLVCHASPSPAFWKGYVAYMESKRKKKVVWTDFRDKSFGWHSHEESFFFSDDFKVSDHAHRQLFYDGRIVRPSCSNCHFTNFRRVGDLTIGDHWGWEKHFSEWNDNKGVSLLLVNTEKGERLRRLLEPLMDFLESNTDACTQPQLRHPEPLAADYEEVVRLFTEKGFKGVARKYGHIPGKKYYQDKLNNYILRVRHILSRIKHSFS